MKSTLTLRSSLQNKTRSLSRLVGILTRRFFLLTLVSLVAVAAVLGIAVSANKANRAAQARAELAANSKSAINPSVQNDKQPNAPAAAVIVATLTDNVTAATKVAPGGTINYTATITNNGAASPADDATNLNYSDTLDANTTLVGGSVHASPIAFNDTYNWVGNTQLDTAARALPAVTVNDVAVNPPAGTDTFTVTAIVGGATALGGVVTLASPAGSFVYTPPLGRPNIADGATVQDSFTYTITNSADPTLTSTGTVRINLTGRVWYLQVGAAGDGRSNTPSSSPAAMSTAADKSTDVFYIFSNAGSLNGPFSVDAGQQLLGQGVNLVVSSITLFTAAAPTPTTTNTAGNCVSVAGAPGNNTLSGFNIGNCTGGTAITGTNVGTLTVSTLSINTNGGALDLTGVGAPTVNIVLGGLTSTGGTKNVNLVGLNGTINLAGGALSSATGNGFDVSGGTAAITYTGTISNSGGKQVNVSSKTGGSASFSGTISGTGTGINLTTNTGATIGFSGGMTLSTSTNPAFTATGGGTVNVSGTNNITTTSGAGINWNADTSGSTVTFNNVNSTTGGAVSITASGATDFTFNDVTSTTGTAVTVTTATGDFIFHAINANGGNKGIALNAATGTFTVNGTSTTAGTGGTVQNCTTRGAEFISSNNITLKNMNFTGNGTAGIGTLNTFCADALNQSTSGAPAGCQANVYLQSTTTVLLNNVKTNLSKAIGIWGNTVSGLTLTDVEAQQNGDEVLEDGVQLVNQLGTVTVTGGVFKDNASRSFEIQNNSGAPTLNITGGTFGNTNNPTGATTPSTATAGDTILLATNGTNSASITSVIKGATFSRIFGRAINVNTEGNTSQNVSFGQAGAGNGNTVSEVSYGTDINGTTSGSVTYSIVNNTFTNTSGAVTSGSRTVINARKGFGATGSWAGTVSSNTIGTVGVADSGCDTVTCGGISVDSPATSGNLDVTITNNTIRRVNGDGIFVANNPGGACAPSCTVRATITGNTMEDPEDGTLGAGGNQGEGVFVATTGPGASLNIKAGGSTAPEKNGVTGNWHGQNAGTLRGVRFSRGANTTFCISGYSGPFDSTSVGTFITSQNTGNAGSATQSLADPPLQFTGPSCSTPIPNPADDIVYNRIDEGTVNAAPISKPVTELTAQSDSRVIFDVIAPFQTLPTLNAPLTESLNNIAPSAAISQSANELLAASEGPAAANVATTNTSHRTAIGTIMHHARSTKAVVAHKLDSMITPTVYAQDSVPNAPTSGENVTLNTIATFPAGGKSITIKYSATINTPPLARQVSTQGTVTATGGINVLTDDPEPAGAANPTVTLVNTTVTYTGPAAGDWGDSVNWTPSYVPGVTNPGVNDVVLPCCNTPVNLGAGNVNIFSLNIDSVILAMTTGSVTISGGAAGSDLTGTGGGISGGSVNFAGAGPHNIFALFNPAVGISSATTLLSPAAVTLNGNLQMSTLAINSGASMTLGSQTLSLKGAGAALVVPAGASLNTTGSTVVFNGSAAQQAAGIAYNNLTINNTLGTNVTGVTLTGNATVNGTLALTSSDLNTGAFTLTQPNTTASTGVSDVVGSVKRTGGPFAPATVLTFGNPNNQISFTAAGTKPTDITVLMAKTAPATYTTAVLRNYTPSQTGGSAFTATLRLHYLDSELNGNTPEANLNLRRLTGGLWKANTPTTVDPVNNFVETPSVLAVDFATQWTFSNLVPTASGGVVTGRIVDQSGNSVEGAVVRLDGTQSRKFITDANGVYRFDNVETNGFYTVTPSRANYSFSPSVRSFSQIGETTEAAFGATVVDDGFENPLDTPEYFVRQHYVDFLGREPDEAGFNFWSDQILECGTDQDCIERRRENVSAAYFLSIEFQQTGGLVDGLYRASHGVRPEFGEFMPDTRAVGLGVVVGQDGWQAKLQANKEAFVNAFVNRPAFHQMYDGTEDSLFVDTLISHTGVTFTSGEHDALVGGLATGNLTRAEALRSIAENSRFVDAKFNETFVMMEYFGYLRRDPDASGYAFWLNKLSEFHGNFERAEMVKAFIVSGEYRDRFPR